MLIIWWNIYKILCKWWQSLLALFHGECSSHPAGNMSFWQNSTKTTKLLVVGSLIGVIDAAGTHAVWTDTPTSHTLVRCGGENLPPAGFLPHLQCFCCFFLHGESCLSPVCVSFSIRAWRPGAPTHLHTCRQSTHQLHLKPAVFKPWSFTLLFIVVLPWTWLIMCYLCFRCIFSCLPGFLP